MGVLHDCLGGANIRFRNSVLLEKWLEEWGETEVVELQGVIVWGS